MLGLQSKPATRRGKRAGNSCKKHHLSTAPQPPHHQKKHMNVSHWNAQSIRNKTDTLNDIILRDDLDVICLTESWLKPDDQVVRGDMCPPGYSVISSPRNSESYGGGIAVVFKSQLDLQLFTDDLSPTSTFQHVIVRSKHFNINLAVIYMPKQDKLPVFREEFEEFLCAVDHLPGKCLVVGDLNLHFDIPAEVKSVNTILSSLNFSQIINVPTHIKGHTLDPVIVKDNEALVRSWTVERLHVSDHFVVNCVLDLLKPSAVKTSFSCRNFRDMDHVLFAKDLTVQVEAVPDSTPDDVNELVADYNHACQVAHDIHAPATEKVRTTRHKPPWFTKAVQDARRARRRCERRWRKSRTDTNHHAYIESQRKVVDTISEEKKAYYNDKLLNSSSSDIYKTINCMLNKNQSIQYFLIVLHHLLFLLMSLVTTLLAKCIPYVVTLTKLLFTIMRMSITTEMFNLVLCQLSILCPMKIWVKLLRNVLTNHVTLIQYLLGLL
jgi:hypothetical protein